ncbi:MAG: hypothetical protein GY892_14155 [Shimia sp.]|nr:hypothetical protein [Shimia sp.]
MPKFKVLSAVLLLNAGAATANTNALKNPVIGLPEAGSFEVVNKWSPKTDYFWCSAARAALERGASHRDRIYVSAAMGPSRTSRGARAVAFTFRPDAQVLAQAVSGTDLGRVGSNMSVAQGKRRCVRELDG